MWRAIGDVLDRLLGLSLQAHDLGLGHMALRVLVVFCFGVALARFADRRMLGQNAGFDIMLLVILGSVLSRGINGQAAFFPTLGASAVLVGLHYVVASLAFRFSGFSRLVKGNPCVLVRDGKVDRKELARNDFTEEDLDESLRLSGSVSDVREVAEARLERNGTVSVVKKNGSA
ncbi:MAG TPA: YetF domain-containing protein [Opitutaceae bacterium]|nr:YetF domain-containing protein [Opitutaceae bacterium]